MERHVDLVKIDVEGAELNALRGAERLLARNWPAIISEFSPGLLPGITGRWTGYLAWLHRHDYRIGVIRPDCGVYYFGWNLLETLRNVGFHRTELQSFWSSRLSYLGSYQFLIVVTKPLPGSVS